MNKFNINEDAYFICLEGNSLLTFECMKIKEISLKSAGHILYRGIMYSIDRDTLKAYVDEEDGDTITKREQHLFKSKNEAIECLKNQIITVYE